MESWKLNSKCPLPEDFGEGSVLLLSKNNTSQSVAFNETTEFETDLFRGRILYRLPCNETETYFRGKRRRESIIIQGNFKERIPMSECLTGLEFHQPVHLPVPWIISAVISLIKRLAGNLYWHLADEDDSRTYFLSSLSATAQVLNTSLKNPPPLKLNTEVSEDCTLCEIPKMDRFKRKAYFKTIRNLEDKYFEPRIVYTFEFFQDLFDVQTFRLRFLTRWWDVTSYLNGQPIQVMSRTDRGYLWNFEVWHKSQAKKSEKLLARTSDKSDAVLPTSI